MLGDVLTPAILAPLRAIAEILVLTYLLYHLLLVIRGTHAAPVFLGMLIVAALYQVSGWLGFGAIRWLIESVLPYAALAIIVIFQTEIRRTLRQLALSLVPRGRPKQVARSDYEDIIFAVAQLSEDKVGALFVLERETALRTFVQSGVVLDARLTSDLLITIFQRQAPLHDGAVIIRRGQVAAAACFLPLTTNPELVRSLGTRHRAAIGITEESDCMTIVVSEMTGRISIALGGNVEQDVSLDRVRLRIIQHFGPIVAAPLGTPVPLIETPAKETSAEETPAQPISDLPQGNSTASTGS